MTVFYPFAFRFFRPLNGYPLVYVFPNQVTIFDEDDDPKGISCDNKSILDS